jgi:hypothetical protein
MEKAPIQDVIEALKKEFKIWYPLDFQPKQSTDDGGTHVEVFIEREVPNERLDGWLLEVIPSGKYMGWRLIITKVPLGYIDLFIRNEKKKDW